MSVFKGDFLSLNFITPKAFYIGSCGPKSSLCQFWTRYIAVWKEKKENSCKEQRIILKRKSLHLFQAYWILLSSMYLKEFQKQLSTVVKVLVFLCKKHTLGEGNLNFCCTDSRENFFRSVGGQNNNNNPKF